MKIVNLIVALFFVFGICAGSFVDASAASSSSAKTEKSSKKSTKKEKKSSKKSGKKSEKKKADKADKKTDKKADNKKSGKKTDKKSDKKVDKKADKKADKKGAKKPAKKTAKTTAKKPLPAAKSISINRAGKEELMALPGVGPKIADAIISHRKGSKFKSIDDLKEVKGIGDKTFADLKKYIKP